MEALGARPADLGAALRDAVEGSWRWSALFHGMYWVSRAGASRVSATYARLERDKRGYWCASMVSTVHAVLITFMSVRALARDERLASGADFFYSTPQSLQATRCFVGYIFSDLVLSVWYRARWPGWQENLAHHVMILMTWSVFIGTRSGQFLAMVAHICELTTPFVNQRWFLYEAGLKSGKVYFYNGLVMVLLWFVTRIVLYSWCGLLLFREYKSVFTGLGVLRGSLVMTCYSAGLGLQFFWFNKMVRGALKSLKGAGAGADAGSGKKTE